MQPDHKLSGPMLLGLLQALFMLLQCGHNADEALRRRKMQAVPATGG